MFTLDGVPRSRRSWALSSDNWTHLLEHMDENPGHVLIVLLRSIVSSMKQCIQHWKRKVISHTKFLCCTMEQHPIHQKRLMTVLEPFFINWLIWINRRPARNSDLSLPNFFLSSLLKDTVYRNKPRENWKMQLKQKVRLSRNACIKKFLEICWGRWMPAKQYATFNSSASCNYYIFKINNTFSITFWNFHRMRFSVTL